MPGSAATRAYSSGASTCENSTLSVQIGLTDLGCRVVPPLGRDGKALLPDDATLVGEVVGALLG
jgi:hypothetical protein